MKRMKFLFIFIFVFFSLSFAQESITIMTYYPSPYGTYNSLLTDKFGVGDNNSDTNLTAADVPAAPGDVWIKGKVGIGTTTPSAKLQINSSGNVDTLNISSSTNTHYTQIIQNNGGGGLGLLVRTGSAAGAGASFKVATSDEATTRLWVGNNGFVGIGTANPAEKLHVAGNVKIDGVIRGATYGFGGMYVANDLGTGGGFFSCVGPNPITGGCNCPSGFIAARAGSWIIEGYTFWLDFCWK
ncbi:MAG: hypothetical protein WC571_05525 [Candidatus Omnitrophota bacterium]